MQLLYEEYLVSVITNSHYFQFVEIIVRNFLYEKLSSKMVNLKKPMRDLNAIASAVARNGTISTASLVRCRQKVPF